MEGLNGHAKTETKAAPNGHVEAETNTEKLNGHAETDVKMEGLNGHAEPETKQAPNGVAEPETKKEAPNGVAEAGSATPASRDPITFFTVVPTVYSRLLATHKGLTPELQRASREAISPAHLRINISGSAALPTPIKKAWRDLSNGNVLLERFGMTEVGMALSCGLDNGDRVDGSVGWPLPSVETRLVDVDTAEVIAPATRWARTAGSARARSSCAAPTGLPRVLAQPGGDGQGVRRQRRRPRPLVQDGRRGRAPQRGRRWAQHPGEPGLGARRPVLRPRPAAAPTSLSRAARRCRPSRSSASCCRCPRWAEAAVCARAVGQVGPEGRRRPHPQQGERARRQVDRHGHAPRPSRSASSTTRSPRSSRSSSTSPATPWARSTRSSSSATSSRTSSAATRPRRPC